jgi:hypothetical protein
MIKTLRLQGLRKRSWSFSPKETDIESLLELILLLILKEEASEVRFELYGSEFRIFFNAHGKWQEILPIFGAGPRILQAFYNLLGCESMDDERQTLVEFQRCYIKIATKRGQDSLLLRILENECPKGVASELLQEFFLSRGGQYQSRPDDSDRVLREIIAGE